MAKKKFTEARDRRAAHGGGKRAPGEWTGGVLGPKTVFNASLSCPHVNVVQIEQLNELEKETFPFSEVKFFNGFHCVLALRSRAAAGAYFISIPDSAAIDTRADLGITRCNDLGYSILSGRDIVGQYRMVFQGIN